MTRLVTLVVLSSLAAQGSAATFSFTKIVESGTLAPSGTFSGFSRPAFDGVKIAFWGHYNSGQHSGIFLSDNGALTTIAKIGDAAPSGTYQKLESLPSISGNTVAFVGQYAGGYGVFNSTGGALTTIAKTGDAAPSGVFDNADFGPASIADGVTTFLAPFGGGISGIFSGSGGAVTKIAAVGDTGPHGTLTTIGSFPTIDSGVVGFWGSFGSGQTALYRGNGGPLTTLADASTPVLGGGSLENFADVTLDGGKGAFRATIGLSVICTIQGGVVTVIAKVFDPAPGGGTYPALGQLVAFDGSSTAFETNMSDALYLNSSGITSLVIKAGDALFGSTVTRAAVGEHSLDRAGSGALAFTYTLADGRVGIAVATAVPEPAGWPLAVLGAACWRRRWNAPAGQGSVSPSAPSRAA